MSPAPRKNHESRGEIPLRVTVRLSVLGPNAARERRDRQLAAIVRLLRRAAASRADATPSRNGRDHHGGVAR